jgi:hypothetical protein
MVCTTLRWREMDSNHWFRHGETPLGRAMPIPRKPAAVPPRPRRSRFVADSPLEGSGFELPVPRCALVANSAALVAPPDPAVRGGSLNGRLTTPIGGGPATARLTRREDRPNSDAARKPW